MANGSKSWFSGFFRLPEPQVPAPNIEQVRALKQQGRVTEALGLCLQMLEVHPDDIDVCVLLPEIAAARGDRDRAVAMYSRVVELRPDHPLAYYKRGNLLKDRGQLETALADYDRAIELDPKYSYALCNRGFVLSSLGGSTSGSRRGAGENGTLRRGHRGL